MKFAHTNDWMKKYDVWAEDKSTYITIANSTLIQPGDEIEVTWSCGIKTVESLLIDDKSDFTSYDNRFLDEKPMPGHHEIKSRKAYFVFEYQMYHLGTKFCRQYLRHLKLPFKRIF